MGYDDFLLALYIFLPTNYVVAMNHATLAQD